MCPGTFATYAYRIGADVAPPKRWWLLSVELELLRTEPEDLLPRLADSPDPVWGGVSYSRFFR